MTIYLGGTVGGPEITLGLLKLTNKTQTFNLPRATEEVQGDGEGRAE